MGGSMAIENIGQRDIYKSFWRGFSGKADNSSMMLNKNADELEAFDREDILAALPDYNGLDVLDIGAGIGRFTSVFAQKARHVTSTDFIEQFIEKNRQRNVHFKNISYKVGDAVNLKMEPRSLDLIFSNWLMMYLNDEDVLHFLQNALCWLKPKGFLHLRESCSESSTGRVSSSLHSALFTNPTRYRFSSVYIELLRAIRFTDKEGTRWRFDVEWSCSVPTYIKFQNNWRQVHWLARKVIAQENNLQSSLSNEALLEKLGTEWNDTQRYWDSILDGERTVWTDTIFESALNGLACERLPILNYNPREVAYHVYVNSHFFAEKFNTQVWNVETNSFFYRTSLTKANQLKDARVRYGWNDSLDRALKLWENSLSESTKFGAFVATELLSQLMKEEEKSSHMLEKIKKVLHRKSFLVTLEPVLQENQEIGMKSMLEKHFKQVSSTDVTAFTENFMHQYLKELKQAAPVMPKIHLWVLFKAQL